MVYTEPAPGALLGVLKHAYRNLRVHQQRPDSGQDQSGTNRFGGLAQSLGRDADLVVVDPGDRLCDPTATEEPGDPSTIVFPMGDYTYAHIEVNAETDSSRWTAPGFDGTGGEFFDSGQTPLDFSGGVQRVPDWTVAAGNDRACIERPGVAQTRKFKSDVVRLRLG